MKQIRMKHLAGVLLLSAALGITGCQQHHKLVKVDAKLIAVDSSYDATTNLAAQALLDHYKNSVDSMMNRVIGINETTLRAVTPEGPLSNLVADVLRESATEFIGKPADMGLVNMGGIRNILNAGPVTVGNIFEILPFENSLCIITVDGKLLKEVFAAIAAKGGDGTSGIQLLIGPDRTLIDGTIDGKPVVDNKLYTIATVDYLAEGNDGMKPLQYAKDRVCPPGATLRDLFIQYVEGQTAQGKRISSKTEGRITVQK